jgi:23S rRNA (cytidine2498-2'-O)-methyltransferase
MQSIVKQTLCNESSPFRLAYSHRGFSTFKTEHPTSIWSDAIPSSAFVRSRGHILCKLEGEKSDTLVEQAMREIGDLDWTHLHVWEPDTGLPGQNGFEPGPTVLVNEVAIQFRTNLVSAGDTRAEQVNTNADEHAKIIDVIIENPGRWWIGTHRVRSIPDAWPGGVPQLEVPLTMISRAYLKAAEAVAWSGLKLKPNERLVEIGSSPGGACQFYLDSGLKVTGVDPADMDETILAAPKFTHVRSRAISLKRRFFSRFHYLACDANVSPNYTLDTVEAIVTHESNRCKAVLLTLKLKEPQDAMKLPEYLQRLQSWGFPSIEARQLAYNRREITVCLKR